MAHHFYSWASCYYQAVVPMGQLDLLDSSLLGCAVGTTAW